jgi:hypothetical protein
MNVQRVNETMCERVVFPCMLALKPIADRGMILETAR